MSMFLHISAQYCHEASRQDDVMMKITKRQFRRIIKKELSRTDRLGITEPKHPINRTVTEKLVSALMQRATIEGMTAEEVSAELGLTRDQGATEYIQALLDNQILDKPIGRF